MPSEADVKAGTRESLGWIKPMSWDNAIPARRNITATNAGINGFSVSNVQRRNSELATEAR